MMITDPSCTCVLPMDTGRPKTQIYTAFECKKCNPPDGWPKHSKGECYCYGCVSSNYYSIILNNQKGRGELNND